MKNNQKSHEQKKESKLMEKVRQELVLSDS